jgi:signal transduction histidine kinase
MRSARGEIYGLMAIATDVSAQVQARKEIERSRDERQRRLDEAVAASRAKDEFLAILGHELRNPLSPIVTSLELMRMHKEGSSQREQEVIRRQVDQLIRLVDDLMDVAAITRGKVRLVPAWSDLRDVVGKAVEMSRQAIEARRHALDVVLPDGPTAWFGDATRLAQVVANLLNNAARYTPPGGRIAVRVAVEATDVVVTVADNGVGIAPELRARVFDAFVQGTLPATARNGGLGVGLAVVKQLVEMHGGTVTIASNGGERGSTFVVRLPRGSPLLPAGESQLAACVDAHALVRAPAGSDQRSSPDAP